VADAKGTSAGDDVRGLLAAIDEEGPAALIARLEAEMLEAARRLEFERAASLRDRIDDVRSALVSAERMGLTPAEASGAAAGGARRTAAATRGAGSPRGRRRPGRRR
jgi:excinuclease ABC subunit B